MSQFDKLLQRFLSRPKDFSYNELNKLLNGFGYEAKQGSGARVKFHNETTSHVIKLHKPHPENVINPYKLKEIVEELTNEGII